MLRVFYKDGEGEWWLDHGWRSDSEFADLPERVPSLADLPSPIRERLLMLVLAEEGQSIDDVGKRVSKDTFWVFV
jgi:hypothetical protein